MEFCIVNHVTIPNPEGWGIAIIATQGSNFLPSEGPLHSATNHSETKIELLCSRGPLNPATYEFHSHLYQNQANISQFQKFWVKLESWSPKMGKNSTKNPLFVSLIVIDQVRP